MFSSCAWGFTCFYDTSSEEIMMCLFVFRRTNNLKSYSSNLIGTNFGDINKEIISYGSSTIKCLLGGFCCSEKDNPSMSILVCINMNSIHLLPTTQHSLVYVFWVGLFFFPIKCLEKNDAYLLLGIKKSEC